MKSLKTLPLVLVAATSCWAASTINTTNQYAWGANIGWTNWRPDFDLTNTEGVVVNEFVCSGYIYAANVGWINMGNGNPVDHMQYQNNSASDFGVNVIMYDQEYSNASYRTAHNLPADIPPPGTVLLRGYAYGANIGWISFESLGNPQISLFTGNLSGYAYSANCGWIALNALDAGAVLRFVETDHILMGTDTNANGIADAWEYLFFGGLLAPGGQNTLSPNGNGMTLLQDYEDGLNPFTSNVALRITAYSTNSGGVNSNVTFTTTPTRLYTIEVRTDLTQLPDWADSGLGMFAPDAGLSTTKLVTQSSVLKRFYRAKTMRPLP